jgi:hypothetical protein
MDAVFRDIAALGREIEIAEQRQDRLVGDRRIVERERACEKAVARDSVCAQVACRDEYHKQDNCRGRERERALSHPPPKRGLKSVLEHNITMLFESEVSRQPSRLLRGISDQDGSWGSI